MLMLLHKEKEVKAMIAYNKGGYSIVQYNFPSLHDFTNYIVTTPISNHFKYRICRSNQDSKESNIDFESALYYCNSGWNINFENLLNLKKQIDKELLFPTRKTEIKRDLVGISPSVPDYLAGNPLSMWNIQHNPEYRCIDVCVNLSCNYRTTEEQIYNRGVIVQSLIDALQYKGYGVQLNAFYASTFSKEVLIAYFGLKNANERLNLKRAYFPLCNPAFIRRLVFRLIEVAPLKNDWGSNYGTPASARLITKLVDLPSKKLIIPEPLEMGIKGEDIHEDLEAFLRYIEFEKFLCIKN